MATDVSAAAPAPQGTHDQETPSSPETTVSQEHAVSNSDGRGGSSSAEHAEAGRDDEAEVRGECKGENGALEGRKNVTSEAQQEETSEAGRASGSKTRDGAEDEEERKPDNVGSPSSTPRPEQRAETGASSHAWSAVWDPARSTYYFWNTQTGETTWTNPLDPSSTQTSGGGGGGGGAISGLQRQRSAGPSSAVAVGSTSPADNEPPRTASASTASDFGGIDPDLAFLDPTLSARAHGGSSSPSVAGHFDPRTGRFIPASQTQGVGARYNPDRVGEAERAKRQMNHMFDYDRWVETTSSERAEGSGEQGDLESGGKKRPSKKELEQFRERKKQKKTSKLSWLRS